jgi:hypothetical protein
MLCAYSPSFIIYLLSQPLCFQRISDNRKAGKYPASLCNGVDESDRAYFTVKETAVNTNHGIQISFTTKITGRGQQWLTRKLLDNGMLKVTGEAA